MRLNLLVIIGVATTLTACRMTEQEKQTYLKESHEKHSTPEIQQLKGKIANLKKKRSVAIETAREYALENAKGLDESKHSYIRHNTPHIYQSIMLTGEAHYYDIPVGEDKRDLSIDELERWDRMQTIMVWYPPAEKDPVTVVATSKHDLSWFEPFKIVRERLYVPKSDEEEARVEARDFAMQELLYLQDKPRAQNMVRFENPLIATTSYKLNLKETDHYSDLDRKQQYVLDRQKLKQSSFIWATDNEKEKVVVSGVWYTTKQILGKRKITDKSAEPEIRFLSNWIPIKAQITSDDELNNFLVK